MKNRLIFNESSNKEWRIFGEGDKLISIYNFLLILSNIKDLDKRQG